MLLMLRARVFSIQATPIFSSLSLSPSTSPYYFFCRIPFSQSTSARAFLQTPNPHSAKHGPPSAAQKPVASETAKFIKTTLFVPPGVDRGEVTEEMILPGSNIVVGPHAGHSQIKEVQFVKSSPKPRDCPKDDRPEFAIVGRSNVGKSSLINALVRKKEFALTSKKPGKTQLINHFLINKSWYLVDLPGYGCCSVATLYPLQPAPNLFYEMLLRNIPSCKALFSTYTRNRNEVAPFLAPLNCRQNPFDVIPQRNHPSHNALLTTYARSGDTLAAWLLFCHMHRTGSHLDGYTFTPVLSACTAMTDPQKGRQVHTMLIKLNTNSNSEAVVRTALIDMYSKCGYLGDAIQMFEELKLKDVVAWNAMLSTFVRHGLLREAVGVFQTMWKDGVAISEFTLCSMLKACASSNALRQGMQVHASVITRGCNSLVVCTALVDFYSDCGMISSALRVFNGLTSKKDDAIYNSLVSGCVRNHKYKEAFLMLGRMKPNAIALTSVLVACSELSNLEYGKQIHCVVIRWGSEFDTLLCNALLDMYAKCGKINTARLIFDRIDMKNVVSWTSIIDAYGSHGQGIEALKLFKEMEKEPNGVSPNSVTFLAVLSACGHSGLVEEGRNCFVSLMKKHGISPGLEHYACFIDLLGRAGKTTEAWDVYDDMIKSNTKPTGAVWIALLNACRVNMDVVRGEFAAKQLFELEPQKPENYILLSNFYAAIGKWEAVEELRRSMKEKGLRKEVGSSWIALECEKGGVASHVAVEVGSSHLT